MSNIGPSNAAIGRRVIEVIKDVIPDIDEQTVKSSVIDDLDSLDRITLIMAIEDEFGVTITEEDSKNLQTVNDVVNCIIQHPRHRAVNS